MAMRPIMPPMRPDTTGLANMIQVEPGRQPISLAAIYPIPAPAMGPTIILILFRKTVSSVSNAGIVARGSREIFEGDYKPPRVRTRGYKRNALKG